MARILVPFDGSSAADYVLDIACCMAGDTGDEVHAIYVMRVPPQLPISAEMPAERAHAERVLTQAQHIADHYRASLLGIIAEARAVGPAIVEAARDCDCIMVGQRPRRRFYQRFLPQRTLRYVLQHARCQVLIGYVPPTPDDAGLARRFILSSHAMDTIDAIDTMEQVPGNVIPLPLPSRPVLSRPAATARDVRDVSATLGSAMLHPSERAR